VVLSRQIEPGQTVAASFNTPTLFIIAEDLASMQLEVAIDEADVGQVASGQRATFTVDAYPGETFPASIERVNVGSNSLASSSSSGSSSGASAASASTVIAYDAILTVDNKGGKLRPGMTATADIAVQSMRDALLVPNSALRFVPGQSGAKSGQQNQGLMTGMTARPRGRSGGGQQERKIGVGSRQTIYVIGDDGQPKPIEVVTGPSDGRNTSVQSRDLKPGMDVITGQRAGQ
jgi:HlyD family secretion protein